MKKIHILYVLMLIIVISGCGGGGGDSIPAPSSSKAITAFSLGGVAGTINETAKTIAITMPFGTNVTSLVATFTTTGSSVKVGSTVQISGSTANNFTNPVTYTVTAADGSTQDYTVVVTVALSSAKAITAFSLGGVAGTINETAKTITVTMPFGTNVTSLVATFTKIGSSVKVGSTVQISGSTANNFTSPVTYTVTAADGTTQNYTVTVVVRSGSFDSPFGIHPAESGNNYAYAIDLGMKWNREGTFFVWVWIDSGRNGNYSFTMAGGTHNYDQERINLNSEDIEMMVNICPFSNGGEFQSDSEKLIYQDFVAKTVERYDGDEVLGCTLASPDCYSNGDGQYPSSELISKFNANPIKYWQVCNQLIDTCSNDCDNTYATKYAEALRLTYEAVKQADPSANVLIAGDSGKQLYAAAYTALGGKYVDIIDFHRFGTYDWYNPKDDLNFLKGHLQSSGFDTSKLRFWITETGTYSGIPTKDVGDGYQSEKQQAEGLFKAYVSALANGIEKIFWAWGIVEGFQHDCSIFDFTGLVYDGVNDTDTCGINYDLGSGVKKLSYYTYKKMVETLNGSDWTNIATIQESSGVYIYKFIKNGNPIWVAWNDNTDSQTISIDVGTITTVKIIEAIPKYVSGSLVTDYNSAFNTGSQTAQSGKITVTLTDVPVFVGETIN